METKGCMAALCTSLTSCNKDTLQSHSISVRNCLDTIYCSYDFSVSSFKTCLVVIIRKLVCHLNGNCNLFSLKESKMLRHIWRQDWLS